MALLADNHAGSFDPAIPRHVRDEPHLGPAQARQRSGWPPLY
jgi:hypothetical protein